MSHRKEVAALLPIAKARGLRAAKFDDVLKYHCDKECLKSNLKHQIKLQKNYKKLKN